MYTCYIVSFTEIPNQGRLVETNKYVRITRVIQMVDCIYHNCINILKGKIEGDVDRFRKTEN